MSNIQQEFDKFIKDFDMSIDDQKTYPKKYTGRIDNSNDLLRDQLDALLPTDDARLGADREISPDIYQGLDEINTDRYQGLSQLEFLYKAIEELSIMEERFAILSGKFTARIKELEVKNNVIL